ncbi:2-C-methyl-D-erythritol 4-phosphate cytidylyltransferase [Leucobacter luti]|uniref:2-C-methyl-D-erythritol 4-phosphate cytidylyltransferase n=1 Tax=Leucobacter luti TaxID=340320 RepID=A0A4Q7TYR8_9MICO|nr:2-C-methyl-D-erythritol 4-phosphate cytidylyltransferase [Leucobacter luti]MBL3698948.1 2-C-methyl-D-erythritol 4-phosphate cytidylyltransferase [Leucobacter luti]RZT66326.1 2-C-methyl-D-erythritol 4-phosphate cytidylyltransferase [Leucobacter luti]
MTAITNDPATRPLATLGVILVGAGSGTRLGADVPKAFVELHGRSLIEFGIGVVTSLPHTGHLTVVIPEARAAQTLALVDEILPRDSSWTVSVVAGGRERHESVRFGIAALPDSVDTVLVHDAARPFASAELFERVAAEVRRTGDAVIPALPVSDTLKRVDADGVVHETVDRAPLVAVQTPQGFRREVLEAAHSARPDEPGDTLPTDDAEVVQRAGARVRTVPGELRAHKLTTAEDLPILEYFLTANVIGLEVEA